MLKARIKKLLQNEIIVNVLTLFSGSTLAQMVPFLIYPIIARLYTPEDFGTLALFSTLMVIMSVFATGKYDQAIMLPAKMKNAINIAGLCLILIAIFWIITMVIALIFGRQITTGLGNPGLYPWIYLLPFAIACYSVFHVMTSILNKQKRYRPMAASRVVQSLSSSGIKLTGGILQAGKGALITSSIAGHMISAIFLYSKFYINNKKWIKILSLKQMRDQAIKYIYFPKFSMFHVLLNSVSAGLPIIIFTRFFSTHETGLYSMAYNVIFIPLSLLAGAIGQVLYQNISEKFNSNKELTPLVKDVIKTLIVLTIIPFLILFIFAPSILGFILGTEWTISGEYQRIILPYLFMVLITSPLVFIPNIFYKQKKAMFIEMISLVLRIIALTTGVYYNSIIIGLILASFFSFCKASYNLHWYFSLIKKHDKIINYT